MDRPDVAGGSAAAGDALIRSRPGPAARRRALPALPAALPDFRQRCPQHDPMRDRHCYPVSFFVARGSAGPFAGAVARAGHQHLAAGADQAAEEGLSDHEAGEQPIPAGR